MKARIYTDHARDFWAFLYSANIAKTTSVTTVFAANKVSTWSTTEGRLQFGWPRAGHVFIQCHLMLAVLKMQ